MTSTSEAPSAGKLKGKRGQRGGALQGLKLRHKMLLLSFAALVVTPILAMAFYLYVIAADQYASRLGFTVRTEEAGSAMDILGGLSRLSTASSSDTDILYKYIQSQELVQIIDRDLDLRSLFSKPTFDPVFSLSSDSSIEDLVDYWKRMVRIYYDPGIGLMEIEVRAFDPVDAKRIAQDLFQRSSERINQLSAIARDDTMRNARDELDTAIERLKTARLALNQFRNETQIVDPSADIQGQMSLLNSLNAQLAEALIELDILTQTTRTSDPRLEQAQRRILVVERRIQEEREKLGVSQGTTGRAFADLVGEFQSLQVDLDIAEKTYVSALSAFDTASAAARRQSRYLAAYIEPTLAQTALYPNRSVIMLVGGFIIFGVWALSVLIIYSLRDRQ
ncbi:MAG: sugar transporter [Roseinatronobacter sp.]